MDIWQRGTSFSGNVFSADRWYGGNSPSAMARSTDVPTGFTYSLDVTGSNHLIGHRIESTNANLLAGKPITVSFYAKSLSGSNTMAVAIGTPSATDNFATSNIEQTSSAITISNSWARYSATFTPLTSAVSRGAFIYIYRNGSTGTDRTLITGVQLEEGAAVTEFRRNAPSIQAELAACQRYYQVGGLTSVHAISATGCDATTRFATEMRTAPTAQVLGNGRVTIGIINLADYQQSASSIFMVASTSGAFFTFGNFSGLTQYRPYIWKINGNQIAFSSEM
jgi:hypothetical protein